MERHSEAFSALQSAQVRIYTRILTPFLIVKKFKILNTPRKGARV